MYGFHIEDETYFLFRSPKFSPIRRDFFHNIDNRILNYSRLPISTLLIQLMNSTGYFLKKQLEHYRVLICETNYSQKLDYCLSFGFPLLLLLYLFAKIFFSLFNAFATL